MFNSKCYSTIPGVSPGRRLLIPNGYLHPGKCEHSEVKSPSINDRRRVTMVRRAWVVISLIPKKWLFIISGRCKDKKLKNCFTQYDSKIFSIFF